MAETRDSRAPRSAGDAPAGPRDTADAAPAARRAASTLTIPASLPMVALLGPGDELLRVVERAFPQLDVHVRGNEISLSGDPSEAALAERLFTELVAVLRTGQGLTADA